MEAKTHKSYIDILRAFAVISVCLYHLPESQFKYGWLGVDVFFVISGYLVIGQVLAQLAQGKFLVRNFVERRVRRVLPSLLTVLCISLILASYFLQGIYLKNFSENLFGALLGGSNITLWKQNNYFDTASELKPLLHTWSLGVEIQFYATIPLFLFILKRLRFSIEVWLIYIAIVSFVIAMYGFYNHPSPAFFLLPTRAFEFLIGGIIFVALNKYRFNLKSQYISNICAAFLYLCLFGVLFFRIFDGFSNFFAILITVILVSTIIIFFENSKSLFLHKALPLLFIGSISYSIYLVHYPLIVFSNHLGFSLFENKLFSNALLLFVVCLLGTALHFLIERPFRYSVSTIKLKWFCVSLYLILIPSAIAQYHSTSGKLVLNVRDDKVEIPIEYGGAYKDGQFCSNLPLGESPCVFEGEKAGAIFVLLGDSHARVLTEAFHDGLSRIGGFVDLSRSGCPFLLGEQMVSMSGELTPCTPEYQKFRLAVLEQLKQKHKLVLILASNLPSYVNGSVFRNSEGYVELDRQVILKSTYDLSVANQKNDFGSFVSSFSESIERLRAVGRVILVAPAIHNGWDPIQRVAVHSKNLSEADLEQFLKLSRSPGDRYRHSVLTAMRASGEILIDPADKTCDSTFCYGYRDGQFMYTDPHHLAKTVNHWLFNSVINVLNMTPSSEDMK